jgi:hypothetical protein
MGGRPIVIANAMELELMPTSGVAGVAILAMGAATWGWWMFGAVADQDWPSAGLGIVVLLGWGFMLTVRALR